MCVNADQQDQFGFCINLEDEGAEDLCQELFGFTTDIEPDACYPNTPWVKPLIS
jgi:hypothetical protein